jgi:Ca2+-binding EF-hand superfamily protein
MKSPTLFASAAGLALSFQLLGLSGVSVAADTPHMGHAVPSSAEAEVQMMDTDKDGKVSASEHALGAKAMFDAMDKDKNAVVTPAEMDAVQKATSRPGDTPAGSKLTSAEKIKAVDTDHDGNLSADEHVAGSRKMFAMMDTDKDGLLTTAELDAGRKLMLSAK